MTARPTEDNKDTVRPTEPLGELRQSVATVTAKREQEIVRPREALERETDGRSDSDREKERSEQEQRHKTDEEN